MTATRTEPVSGEVDVPHPPGSDPLWSENFFFSGYDPDHGIGLVSHISTIPDAPWIWQGVLTVYLPDGEVLVAKSTGRADDPMQAGPETLRLTCAEPGRHWRMSIDGVARRLPQLDSATAPVPDGLSETLSGEVAFTGHNPAWHLRSSTLKGQDWGDVHLQQTCEISGHLVIRGQEITVSGPAFRDHTSGPRDVTPYREDTWAHGSFPSGLSFMALDARGGHEEHQAFRVGYICRDGILVDAPPKPMPRPPFLHPGMEPLSVQLNCPEGPLNILVEPLAVTGFTIAAPQQWCLGVDLTPDTDELLSINAPARFHCNGEVGYGHLERMIRASDYQPPTPEPRVSVTGGAPL